MVLMALEGTPDLISWPSTFLYTLEIIYYFPPNFLPDPHSLRPLSVGRFLIVSSGPSLVT